MRSRRRRASTTRALNCRGVGSLASCLFVLATATACGRGRAGPLVETTVAGSAYCTPSDPHWNSSMAFTTDWYANQGSEPVTIKSLRLIQPHGLVLHGAVVYEMLHDLHALNQADPWPQAGTGSDPRMWAARQTLRGAVIPPGHAKYALIKFSKQDNIYVVAENVSATTSKGGWALGEVITYESGGQTYTVEAHTGIAIASATAVQANSSSYIGNHECDAAQNAFKTLPHN